MFSKFTSILQSAVEAVGGMNIDNVTCRDDRPAKDLSIGIAKLQPSVCQSQSVRVESVACRTSVSLTLLVRAGL